MATKSLRKRIEVLERKLLPQYYARIDKGRWEPISRYGYETCVRALGEAPGPHEGMQVIRIDPPCKPTPKT